MDHSFSVDQWLRNTQRNALKHKEDDELQHQQQHQQQRNQSTTTESGSDSAEHSLKTKLVCKYSGDLLFMPEAVGNISSIKTPLLVEIGAAAATATATATANATATATAAAVGKADDIHEQPADITLRDAMAWAYPR